MRFFSDKGEAERTIVDLSTDVKSDDSITNGVVERKIEVDVSLKSQDSTVNMRIFSNDRSQLAIPLGRRILIREPRNYKK